jgi:hypothetical protein
MCHLYKLDPAAKSVRSPVVYGSINNLDCHAFKKQNDATVQRFSVILTFLFWHLSVNFGIGILVKRPQEMLLLQTMVKINLKVNHFDIFSKTQYK